MPKKSKKFVKPEIVEELEVSSDEDIEVVDQEEVAYEDDEEDRAAKEAKNAASLKNTRRKARQSGYRKLAQAAGAGVGKKSSNKDIIKYAISESDLKRLAQWAPETGDGVGNEEELRNRLVLKYSSLPSGAAVILHANVEAFARNIMSDVVDRVRDGASSTVTAAHMRSALRKFQGNLDFDFELPRGIVSHARVTEKGHFTGTGADREWVTTGNVLPEFDDEEKVKDDEFRVSSKALGKLIKSKERTFQLKKEENRKRRLKIVEERRDMQKEVVEPVAATV